MRFLSLLFASLLVSATVSAQRLGGNHNEAAGPVNTGFGVKAGVNIASMYDVPKGIDSEGITSFHFGAYGKLGLSESWALQLEALYSRRGADFRFDGDSGDDVTKMRFDYIDVPLLLSYNIVGEGTWSIMAGPQASLMLTAKDQNDKEIDKNGLHTFDMGAAAGVQFGYKIFRIGGRYNVGLRDVLNPEEGALLGNDFNFRNHYGQVYLAVEF